MFIRRIFLLAQLFFMHCPQLTLKKCVNFIIKVFPCQTGTHFYFSHYISYWKGPLPWRLYQKTGSLCCLAKARRKRGKMQSLREPKVSKSFRNIFSLIAKVTQWYMFFCSNPQTTWCRSAFSSSVHLPWVIQNECTGTNKINLRIHSENICIWNLYNLDKEV